MSKSLIPSGTVNLIKQNLRPFARKAKQISAYLLPQKGDLMFVFSGRHSDWLHIGRSDYKKFESYRNSVRESVELIGDNSKHPLLPVFEKEVEGFFDDPMNRLYVYNIVRVALVDFFRQEGIEPDAVFGVSMGEIPAMYAADAITKRDLFTITRSYRPTIERLEERHIGLLIGMGYQELCDFIKSENPDLYPVYQLRDDLTIALVDEEIITETVERFNSMGIRTRYTKDQRVRAYHTDLVLDSKAEALDSIRNIEIKPLRCDFYSSSESKKFERGTILSNDHLFSFRRKPVKAHSAFEVIRKEEKNYHVLQLGPDLLRTEHFLKMLTKKRFRASSFSSLRTGQGKNKSLMDVIAQIRSSGKVRTTQKNQNPIHHTILRRYYEGHPDFTQDPYPYFNFLRSTRGIFRIPYTDEWIVLGYDEIKKIFHDPETFSNKPYSYLEELLLGADPPQHTRIRALLQPLFSRKEFTRIGEKARQLSAELIDQFPVGNPFNIVEALSNPLTRGLNAKFLGFPEELEQKLIQLTDKHPGEEVLFNELLQSITDLSQNRSSSSATGGLKFLLELAESGEITASDVPQLLRLLWLAGTETTASMISSSIHRLLLNPEIAATLSEEPKQIYAFLDECIRLEPPFSEIKRLVTKDVSISGVDIPAGTTLTISIRSANRDETVFSNPNQFIMNRQGARHLSFGSGIHYCIGMAIGRAEAVEVIRAILDRYAAFSLSAEGEIAYQNATELRALKSLQVVYTP